MKGLSFCQSTFCVLMKQQSLSVILFLKNKIHGNSKKKEVAAEKNERKHN